MANLNDIKASALRIRAAVESLTNPDDVAIVRDYLTELELIAARQEAEDAWHMDQSLHSSIHPQTSRLGTVQNVRSANSCPPGTAGSIISLPVEQME